MNHTGSNNLISALHDALRLPARNRKCDSHRAAGEFAAHGWVFLSELIDEIEMHDRRFYAVGELIEDLCQAFELPIRWVMFRPRSHLSDSLLRQAMSAVDAAALVVNIERLGFQVEPVPFVEAVSPEISRLGRLSNAEFEVTFFEKTRHRQLTRLATGRLPHSGQKSRFRTDAGYLVDFEEGNGHASLTVRGPKYRSRKPPVNVRCEYCDISYLQGDLESALNHRRRHRRKQHAYEPKPNRRLIERLALDSSADRVDAKSSKWMHHEVYERAMMFKTEMKYDFPQWASPPVRGRTDEDGIAYLLTTNEEPGRIVGACAFRARANGWTLDWAWVAPNWRRKGVLRRYWPRLVSEFGDFHLEFPVSPGMTAFVQKCGTETQKTVFQRHSNEEPHGGRKP